MFSNASAGDPATRSSVYQRVLGEEGFARLDPQLRAYFGAMPDGCEGFGEGRYERAGLRIRVLRPVFALLARRGIAFPDRGTDVAFTVRNTAEADGSLRALRTFAFAREGRVMEDRTQVVGGHLVDRIGRGGEIEAELDVAVVDGGLRMSSRRIAVRWWRLRVPLTGLVRVRLDERATGDRTCPQRVEVRISAPLIGELYGYVGDFAYRIQPLSLASFAGRSGSEAIP